jgi:hypothetical protein
MPVLINCTFSPQFPNALHPAVQRAVATWGQLLNSPLPVRVRAIWEPQIQLPPNLSAMCIPQGRQGLHNLTADTWYASSVAKKLAGGDPNLGEQDMALLFNTQLPWYGGTGAPGPNQYDMESITLHEMGHGLGFVGLFWYDAPFGSYGNNAILNALPPVPPALLGFVLPGDLFGWPSQYGRKVIDSNNVLLVSGTYGNGSVQVGQALNGAVGNGQLRYRRPTMPQGGHVLYVPPAFAPFSSIEHLNDVNSLMYFTIPVGAQHRQVDPPVLDILRDLGW